MRCRILVVDDHTAFCEVTLRFLRQRAGEEVDVTCTNPGCSSVVDEVQRFEPNVILVSLSIPDPEGLARIPSLRSTAPKAKIIATTMLEVESYREVVLAAGADDVVSKAAFSTDLIPAIQRQLANLSGEANGGPPRAERNGHDQAAG